jgi:hypothetical protein
MSEAAASAASEANGQNRVTELKVSGHLMTLDTGLFCLFQSPSAQGGNDGSGLPGVRVSLPPNADVRPDAVTISTFRQDGWLSTRDDAALVRVASGPAQILVTIYQSPGHRPEAAPRLQVLRLSAEGQLPAPAPQPPLPVAAAAPASPAATGAAPVPGEADLLAHVQRMGDVGATLGDWIGTRGSRLWIEGFGVAPRAEVAPSDIEYQAVLGRDWLSPWVEGGKFCGSRGMALPLLGLRLRLKGTAAEKFDCKYSASFVDGTDIGPVSVGESCEAESLAPLEAFKIVLTPKSRVGMETGARQAPAASSYSRPRAAAKPAKPAGPARKAADRKRR